MANDMIRMTESERVEDRSAFDGTGTAYFIKYVSEDGAKIWWHIFAAGDPSTNYNDAPLDSHYTDTTNHIIYIMTAAATWTKVASNT